MTQSGFTRPHTLYEVSRRVAASEQAFDPATREFLDHFYANPSERVGAIAEQPLPLGDLQDAYIAAVAEHLASAFGLSFPQWAEHYGLALKLPFFAGGLESLKATLTIESPAAFRRRMLFVSKDALSRPRQPG